MILRLQSDPLPLRQEEDGAIRIGKTRVLLELVIQAHLEGLNPPEIVNRYPSLQLADVYAVVTFYLRHKDEVEAYLRSCEEEAEIIRKKIEAAGMTHTGLREEFEARWAQRGSTDAPSPQ
jgi:uncharacterized protein (DUF433 family)